MPAGLTASNPLPLITIAIQVEKPFSALRKAIRRKADTNTIQQLGNTLGTFLRFGWQEDNAAVIYDGMRLTGEF
jgi:hypothetical protein